MILLEKAKEVISNLFSDTSVSIEETRDMMQELAEIVEKNIETIEAEISDRAQERDELWGYFPY